MINSEEIPIGYRFTPTDEELTTYYLRKKVEGEDMTWFSHVISEQDLYGELPPWVIFDQYGGRGEDDDHIRYFYTRLKKKHGSGEMVQRTVGKNKEYCWDGTAKGIDIYDHRTMTVIGVRKQYSLIRSKQKKGRTVAAANSINSTNKRKEITNNTPSNDVHEANDNGGDKDDKSFGNWIMHEYSLVNHRSSSSSNGNQNYVLCRIRMKKPPTFTAVSTTSRSNANTSRVHGSINTASTTTRNNASTSGVHGSINNSTTKPAVLPSCSTSQMFHGQQQQDHLPGAADHVAVSLFVQPVPTGAGFQINHQDNGYLWQHPYADHNSTTIPAVLPSCSTSQMFHDHLPGAADHVAVSPLVLPTGEDYQINHQDYGYLWQHPYDDQLFQQGVQQHQQQSVLMYDQEQPAATTMEVSLGSGSEWECRGLDTSGGDGSSSHDNNILDTIMNLGNAATGLDNLGHDKNNCDTNMNTLEEDTICNDLIWDQWVCPFPPSPQPPSGSQFCNATTVKRS